MMECDVKDHCKTPTLCYACEPWYRDYVRACKERGIPATSLRPRTFRPIDDTAPRKGEEMTIEEAAQELGVSERTIKDYISKGRLEKSDDGVSDESVEAYKERREQNMKKIVSIDSIDVKNAPDETLVYVELGLLKEAIARAKEMGRAEGYSEARKEFEAKKIDRKTLSELIAVS